MKFRQETWRGSASFLRYWHLKYIPEKPNSYITIYVPIFRCHVVALIEVERFRIVAHCYATSFSQKLILSREYYVWHKDNNKFWKFIKNEHEVMLDSQKFCLCQQLFAFREFHMKTRLHNISETTNTTTFTKTILESSYKFLLGTCNLTVLKQSIFLLRALEF